jgi:hypothetical protein
MTNVLWQSRQMWISVRSDSTVLTVFWERHVGQGRGVLLEVFIGFLPGGRSAGATVNGKDIGP